MSTEPVTLMVGRRVTRDRYRDFTTWLHEGELLAADFPGYLGSGVLAPPPDDDEYQIIFRFSDEASLALWEHSASRTSWLQRGSGLFNQPHEHRIQGLNEWFGNGHPPAPRWKQSIAIWLAFFPVCLAFNLIFQEQLASLSLTLRVLVTTLTLTPLMTYAFIPLVSRWLDGWLHGRKSPRRLQRVGQRP